MPIRTAGIIIIGNEVLSGTVKDENIQFLCQRLHDRGIRVDKIAIIGDNVDNIAEEVREYSASFDLVITSGGVGPTHDDVTYEGLAKAFGLELELNEELLNYWKLDPQENEVSAKNMSLVPKTSSVIYAEVSDCGRCPVVVVLNVYTFPGTPKLLQSRFSALEQQYFDGCGTKFYKQEIYLSVDETDVISALNFTVNQYSDVSIGSYPVIDNFHYCTRLTLHSHEESRVKEAHSTLVSLIESSWILDPNVFLCS